jgi:transcriptional regulator with XRE-family HTH domain
MPNIASVMREEITRLSRRASRKDLDAVKKISAQHRRHIAAMKRDIAQLARAFSALSRKLPAAAVPAANGSDGKQVRFVAKGLRSHRERLGLSADQLAKLVGVSAQSVYNWEHGITRPREAQLGALATLRRLGKRDVRARLEQLDDAQQPKQAPATKASRTRARTKELPRKRAKKPTSTRARK